MGTEVSPAGPGWPEVALAGRRRAHKLSREQFWTVSDLPIVVKAWYDVEYSSLGSYRLLHECGLSYQQTEQVSRSRPNAQTVAGFAAELEKTIP